ncbi:MAG TPA: helix-turn-helix domain-containing protein [Bryobacteraceae bacterium]|nr:helix-turn-helix domain-containing protein [Bryobacteraceae bacterium]
MKSNAFEELLESAREGGAILRGEKNASRRVSIKAAGVRAIRERTNLSQSEFATLIGVSVNTLQNWEGIEGIPQDQPRYCFASSNTSQGWP